MQAAMPLEFGGVPDEEQPSSMVDICGECLCEGCPQCPEQCDACCDLCGYCPITQCDTLDAIMERKKKAEEAPE